MSLENAFFNDNKEQGRFELHIDSKTAFIDYSNEGEKVILIHTEVPEELEGNGVAAALVERTFEYLEENGKKIVPSCSYVRVYLRKHKDWERLVA